MPIWQRESGGAPAGYFQPETMNLIETERQLPFTTLQQARGVKSRAAGILGTNCKSLRRRMEKYGIESQARRERSSRTIQATSKTRAAPTLISTLISLLGRYLYSGTCGSSSSTAAGVLSASLSRVSSY